MERDVIRLVPINFVLLLLASIRWGNKMQYNTEPERVYVRFLATRREHRRPPME